MREWLRTIRTESQMTMLEASQKLGISESYYSLIENGTRQKKMDIELISKLSHVFGIPITSIIGYESKAG